MAEKFVENIKEELEEMSSEQLRITVSRKDLETLVKAYEQLKNS